MHTRLCSAAIFPATCRERVRFQSRTGSTTRLGHGRSTETTDNREFQDNSRDGLLYIGLKDTTNVHVDMQTRRHQNVAARAQLLVRRGGTETTDTIVSKGDGYNAATKIL
ncbi:hypothetical protein C2845_PM07G00930 [Panicum miliaceum]|uniref:Uncharacterized protein n=1 Tax=Panicum miliaceum TaxID=4540 RepID=A0A3L6SKW7_PANMI|nr:hypothetical protein C2845_PM07G00930 [Panicum miliaceum]